MIVFLDRFGFPYLQLPSGGGVGLFPLTRSQVEFDFGDVRGTTAGWYLEALAVAPRGSFRDPAARMGVFVTGLTADEADRFARWLDPAARLPTPAEWRTADTLTHRMADPTAAYSRLASDPRVHPAAAALLDRSREFGGAVGRFNSGILEWVRSSGGEAGLYGRPDPKLYPLLLEPQAHPPACPMGADRHRAFGARLYHPSPG